MMFLKGLLKQIASQLQAKTGWQVKIFVDTAPLMEKAAFGQSTGRAGLARQTYQSGFLRGIWLMAVFGVYSDQWPSGRGYAGWWLWQPAGPSGYLPYRCVSCPLQAGCQALSLI